MTHSEDKLYYTPPTEEQFMEVKIKAIALWSTYDNTYGYADEKISRIKDIKNVGDNFMYIIAMFDVNNQLKLANELSDSTRKAVSDRIISGGNPPEYNMFLRKEQNVS